ncbi:hypothetical protein JCGZ_16335 [Jatropha curcas]|uniref:Uncharacterized protein n=1 Tax=Jatropha curcas TaxID=180498 RepID=A0A067L7V7_JATCU|nr:hypothetical protein JCGZ_16335 [Jatropha curcas]
MANPEFTNGVESGTVFGKGSIKGVSEDHGNRYIIAHSRKHSLGSFSQKVQLEEGKLYSFSVKNGSEDVAVVFRRANGELIHGGRVTSMDGCWSFLKRGILTNFASGPADILFESFLDTLASLGLPIWLTEVDVASSPNQAKYLASGASTKGKPFSSCCERDYHLGRTRSGRF